MRKRKMEIRTLSFYCQKETSQIRRIKLRRKRNLFLKNVEKKKQRQKKQDNFWEKMAKW